MESFDHALEANPRFAAALNNRGSALFDLGRSRGGGVLSKQSFSIEPGIPSGLV